MNDSTDANQEGTAVSRRTVLVGSAVAIGGAVGFAGTAAGQTTVTGVIERPRRWEEADLNGFTIEMPDPDGEDSETAAPAGDGGDGGDSTAADATADDETAGAGGDGEQGTDVGTGDAAGAGEAPETPDCDYQNWPPDEVERYDVRLVNRKEDDAPEEDTNLWVSADVEIGEDARYLINEHEDCGDGFVGVQLEDAGEQSGNQGGRAEENVEDFEEGTPAGDGQTEGVGAGTPESGPGFGVLAALAAAAGLGGLLSRRSD